MLILLILLLIYLRWLSKDENTRNDHSKALFDAVQAGFLYFLDQEDKYASLQQIFYLTTPYKFHWKQSLYFPKQVIGLKVEIYIQKLA